MQDRPKGLLIILFGVLIISPDAVLVRYLSEGGAEPWTIIFWKMLFAIPITAVFAVWEAGSFSQLWSSMVYSKKYYAIAIPLQCVVDIFFTLSFVYTSAALALLLINLNPLWCAVAGRLLLGDQLKKKTYLALVLAFGCMLIIFIPELLPTKSSSTTLSTNTTTISDDTVLLEPAHLFESSMKGNIIALCTGLGLAAYITVVRHGSLKGGGPSPTDQGSPHAPPPKINLVGAAAISATVTMLLSVLVRKGDVLPSTFWTGTTLWSFWIAQIAEGCAIGIIFIVMTIAPRYITGAEVGLCVLLEAVLGPFFVYLAYGDVPSTYTLIGGGLLLTVLAVHESRPLFEKANTVRRSISRRFSQPRNSRSSSSSRSAMMIAKQHQQQQQLEEEEEEEEQMNDGNPLKDENSDDPVAGVGASVHDTIDKEEECC